MEKKYPIGDKYPSSYYQPLFDHMRDQHGLILLSTEMSDIIELLRRLDSTGSTTPQGAESSKQTRPYKVVTKEGDVYDVHKYINNDGEENIWCDEWYGHHIIGKDCEWYEESQQPEREGDR